MARVIRKEVKAADLPREWQAGLDAAPDEVVRVTVDARSMRCIAPNRSSRLLIGSAGCVTTDCADDLEPPVGRKFRVVELRI